MNYRTIRRIALAAACALFPAAALGANCNAGTFNAFKACVTGATAGDTITLTANIQPDGSTVLLVADVTLVNNGFQMDGGVGALVVQGPHTLTLPSDNAFTGGTNVVASTVAIGSGGALGTGVLNLVVSGTIRALGSMVLGTTPVGFVTDGKIAAVNGATLGVANLNLLGGATATLGDPVDNGTLELSGNGAVAATANIVLGGGIVRAMDPNMVFDLVAFSGSTTLAPTARLETNGQSLTVQNLLGAGEIVTSPGATLVVYTGNYGGVISGDGGLIKDNNAAGDLILTGTNTYTGVTTNTGGVLQLGNGGTTGSLGTGPVIVNFELSYNRSNAYTISAPIAGGGTLRNAGSGTLTLSAMSTFTGLTFVDNGALSVMAPGSIASSAVILTGSGVLQGTGTTGPVTTPGVGTILPGNPVPIGLLTIGSMTLGSAATVGFQINGPGNTPGTGYDQLAVIGAVSPGNANMLATFLGYVPVAGDIFVLISNDNADAIAGSFQGVPEGATMSASGVPLVFSYMGGDGNDFTLSVVSRTVTPSVVGSGTISPSVPTLVIDGTTTVFTVTPSVGFIATMGGTCPAGTLVGTTYTTGAIVANCTVVATFTLASYAVTSTAGANGTITPPSQPINHGSTAVFTVTPSVGYNAVIGGTCPAGTLVGTTYTTGPITGVCNVAATFTQVTYTVTPAVAGTDGTIVPNTPQVVAHGATAVFTVTPNAGFNTFVGGSCPAGTLVGTTYTTGPITANCAVVVNFASIPITTFTGPTATGSGNATATLTGGGVGCSFGTRQFIPVTGHAASPPAGSAPTSVTFPHGLFDFTLVGCTQASTVTLTITYPSALPPGTSYWKYGPEPGNITPHWYIMPATIGGATVVFSITDGQQGDDDLSANGIIVDQGGPGVPPAGAGVAQTPTLSEWALLLLIMMMLASGAFASVRQAGRSRR